MPLTPGQQRCVNTLDRPLVVAAGAGSGKTFTLTKRIVHALETGFVSDIDEVCAITFTNKAAAELKSRLKGELRACGMVDQALKVDEAWVSTIHGMCSRILRAHAIELGIDPTFAIAESAQVDALLDQAVDTVLSESQAEGASPRIDALFAEYPAKSQGYGTSVQGMLSDLVSAAQMQAGGADAIVLPGVTLGGSRAAMQAVDVVQAQLSVAELEKASASRDKWIAQMTEQVSRACEAIDSGEGDPGKLLAVIAPFTIAKNFGTKDYRAQAEEARLALNSAVMELRLAAARPHLETLVELARHSLAEFARLKRDAGVLDNNDLLTMASRAISQHPAIAGVYRDKFKLVMVDEFQDTDQMQVDMIAKIAGSGAERLCTVGDAQQSIYRFRGADVSVYRRHLEAIRSTWPDGIIELSDNFRSHADVLAFVDRVFEKPDMFGGEFMSLAAGRDEASVKQPFEQNVSRITVQHTSIPSSGVLSSEAVDVAARRIAAEFARLVHEGHAAGEMVVLLGRMSNAGAYARALRDEGLSCVISGGSVFADSLEALVAAELVRTIANPGQTKALFNVLTSLAFCLCADDLLHVGGLKAFVRAALSHELPEGCSTRLACALRVMGGVFADAARVPVARLVERVFVDSGWLTRLEAQGAEGLAAAGNLFKAVRMIDSIERSGPFGPASVAKRFADTLASSKEAPGALSVTGGDSVRIMTMHASKGLEFPIVAVAELKETRVSSSCLLVSAVGGKTYASLDLSSTLEKVGNKVDSSALSQLDEYILGLEGGEEELASVVAQDEGALHRRLALRVFDAAGEAEEAKRLLYVALTRAKEALVVSTVGKRTKDNPIGLPKSVFAAIAAALDPSGVAFGEGRTLCDFGGLQPAIVEHVALTAGDAADDDAVSIEVDAGREADDSFTVPVDSNGGAQRAEQFEVYRPAHEGVFSYSSISEAAHEGDVLSRLAERFAMSCDVPLVDESAETLFEAAFDDGRSAYGDFASSAATDDDFWDTDLTSSFDEDRATDLGTAFHRLAQYAVNARRDGERLEMPPIDRIEALSRTCNLDGIQRGRLSEALERWFASDLAGEMAQIANLHAEVPFFVSVPSGDGQSAFLEGEIDLLALEGGRASVVDYKTGGHADESDETIREKHVLQAACYAYAIMRQGIREVDAIFVRVERPRSTDGQPQCVRYHFELSDLPALERAIAEVYAKQLI